jgi:cullin 1
LALVKWREKMFESLHKAVVGAALSLVKRQRDGETIDINLIKGVVESFGK